MAGSRSRLYLLAGGAALALLLALAAALVAAGATAETVRRVLAGRRAQLSSSSPSESA